MSVKFLGKGLVSKDMLHEYVNRPEYIPFKSKVEELYQQFIADGVLEVDDDNRSSMDWFSNLSDRGYDSRFTVSQMRKFIPTIREAAKLLKGAPIVVDEYMGKVRGYECFETTLTGELYDYKGSSCSLWGLVASGEGINKKQKVMVHFFEIFK